MPAEWAPHDATWIAWPHHEPDWPGKIEPIHWVYAEIVRRLAPHERVEILCHDEVVAARAHDRLGRAGVAENRYRLHVVANDRSWVRDSGPTAVHDAVGGVRWIHWQFNAWARYDNFGCDVKVATAIAGITGLGRITARRPGSGEPLVLEGGSIDTDGEGTLLTTEECLLSDVQCRNPGMSRADYERAFGEYLGITRTIWLGGGIEGDDTHGHVDDIARFVAPGVVVLAYEKNPGDVNHAASAENLQRLLDARDAAGRPLQVVRLPMPGPLWFEGARLPASYANFYVANRVVLVPTFNDPNDRVALNTLAELFPGRQVIGIHAVDLVLGNGTLHCLTQPQPATRS
jgi:agmatine deiminase